MRAYFWIALLFVSAITASSCASMAVGEKNTARARLSLATTLLNVGSEVDDAERNELAERIHIKKTDSFTLMGHSLFRAKLTMDASDLDAICKRQREGNKNFRKTSTRDKWVEHAFGDKSGARYDEKGSSQVSWWKPSETRAREYVTWHSHYANKPRTWVYLQICELNDEERLVYLRIESG